MNLNKRIFNSVEEIKETYGIDVKLPQSIPEGCNIIGYECCDLGYIDFYKETSDELLWYSNQGFWAHSGNLSLNGEVADDISNEHEYVYLRVERHTKKDKFTLRRLLGVETNEGFINKLNQNIKGFVNIGYTTCDPRDLKYYISDDSDETASFDEYVDMFYERSSL